MFGGDTHQLIPLYMIGVFLSFTLSQTGMFLRWRRLRPPGWQLTRRHQRLRRDRCTGVVLVIVAHDEGARGRVDRHRPDPGLVVRCSGRQSALRQRRRRS